MLLKRTEDGKKLVVEKEYERALRWLSEESKRK